MPTQELICSEIWGGNGSVYTELVMPGLRGVLFSRACGGKKGGDVYYSSACAAGVISRMCLADVAGHGEQVAQVGAWLHGTMRRNMGRHDPARVFHTMNERASLFGLEALTTAVCLSYDMMKAELRFCYAGHPPAFILPHGESRWLPLEVDNVGKGVRNVPFGVSDTAAFDTGTRTLQEGDRLFVYSDGVLEAADANHELFGSGRLAEALDTVRDKPIHALARNLEGLLAQHTGAPEFTHDDVTFVVLEAGPRALEPKLWHLLRNQSRKHARRR